MTTDLKIAIVGAGRMAEKHATAIRLQNDVRLVAVADAYAAPETVAERFGRDVAVYEDASRLLEQSGPDVVHIVTPPSTHFEIARQCLESGASVYVEKPFSLTLDEANTLLDLAEGKGLKACAGHQVLFQRSGQKYQTHLGVIGEIMHVESYFSFRPVRRRPDGGTPLSDVDQLIDILPHPVYLMLSALNRDSDDAAELVALHVEPEGEVRAVIRAGQALGTLIVTLRGRPIESYLRVVGRNGSVEADFILGDIVKSFGPGASGPAVAVKPFSQSTQKFWGSFAGILRLLLRRQKSYPGLGELLEKFYASVRNRGVPPISRASIAQTVAICQAVSERLAAAAAEAEKSAQAALDAETGSLAAPDSDRGVALVTGGSGFLGRAVVGELRASGWPVRAVVRRAPPAHRRVAGVEYVEADLSGDLPADLLSEVSIVLHLAAETMGNRDAHERNTINATRNLLDAMEAAGIRRLINIGSVAELKPGPEVQDEQSPVDRGNLSRGPYVWAKAEAECLAVERARKGSLDVRTVRLGPLVDFSDYTPPGRLGREVARLFVAVGSRRSELSVCDVHTAARVLRHYSEHFDEAPACVNLVEVPANTRGELADRLRAVRPDLVFFWLPFPVLRVLAATATLAQKIVRRGKPPLDVYAAFKSERYDPTIAEAVITAAGNGRHAGRSASSSA